jgi:hypothetical protein
MTREDIIRMAREAGAERNNDFPDWSFEDDALERFAASVAAHEREKVAQWMVKRGYATGHGDTVEDLLKELDWQVAEREREACAMECIKLAHKWTRLGAWGENNEFHDCAAAIRARGEK